MRPQLFSFEFGAFVTGYVAFGLCFQRRAVTVAGANDRPCFFDPDFDAPVCAVLLRVGRVITERILVSQLFGYIKKSLRDVGERVGVVETPAAAVGEFLQVTRRPAVFVTRSAAGRRHASRPLREDQAKRPASAASRRRRWIRPRPGIAIGRLVAAAVLMTLGVVF